MVYRSQDIDALKQEIESLKVRRDPTPATQQDIHNVRIVFTQGTTCMLKYVVQSTHDFHAPGLKGLPGAS